MPVNATTADPQQTRFVRERILETLRFKGYPMILFEIVDNKLAAVNNKLPAGGINIIHPAAVGPFAPDDRCDSNIDGTGLMGLTESPDAVR